ncbi:MAG: BON domain-containing protein [Candidatus Tectomicrobia bacterium]
MACKASFNGVILLVAVGLMSAVHLSPARALSDDVLRQRIEKRAHNDERLEGTRVVVAVQDGGVVLYGSVWLYSQKMLYERIAWRVYGVAEVDNEILVEPRVPVPDQEIKSMILNMLPKHQRLQEAGISVTVTKGHVHLHGTFRNPGDVLFLKHRVAEIAGVIHIEIEVQLVV